MRSWVPGLLLLAIAGLLLLALSTHSEPTQVTSSGGHAPAPNRSAGPRLEPASRRASYPVDGTPPTTTNGASPGAATAQPEDIDDVQDAVQDDVVPAERSSKDLQAMAREAADPTKPAWRRPPPGRPSPHGVVRREDAVLKALRWLAAHQALDGHFAAAEFGRWCEGRDDVEGGPGGAGQAEHDVGATALALLAYLGAGYTHRGEHEFTSVVLRGVRWLRVVQDRDGWIRTSTHPTWAWDHACAAWALVEAYGQTESFLWKDAAQRALTTLETLRQPGGVWRYGVRADPADVSLTFWATLPWLTAREVNRADERAGKPARFVLDATVRDAVSRWIDGATDVATGTLRGGAGSSPSLPGESALAMTALAALWRFHDGESAKTEGVLQRAMASVASSVPSAEAPPEAADVVHWWAGTLAAFNTGPEPWKAWDRFQADVVVAGQQLEGDACMLRGSWDPTGAWAAEGGRVVTTALLCLSLELYYRYSHVPLSR